MDTQRIKDTVRPNIGMAMVGNPLFPEHMETRYYCNGVRIPHWLYRWLYRRLEPSG